MSWMLLLYVAPLFVGAAAAGVLSLAAARRREIPAARHFALLLALVAFWGAAEGIETLVPDLAGKEVWDKLQYISLVSTPILWLLVGVRLSGRGRWFARWGWLMPAALAVATLALLATNDRHGLIWPTVTLVERDGASMVAVTHGPWWWINTTATYAQFILGSALVLGVAFRRRAGKRRTFVLTVVGAGAGMLAGVANILGVTIGPIADPVPCGVTLGALVVAYGHFRFRLLDAVFGVLPVAHQTVVDGLDDGVVVFDADQRVAYINPAARRILRVADDWAIGQDQQTLVERGLWPEDLDFQGEANRREVALRREDGVEHYDARCSHLLHGRTVAGCVVVLRDITERKVREERLAHLAQHDPLTGLPNRRTLEIALESALLRAARGHPCALLYMDADGFKTVNDTLGHAAGDKVLAALAQTISHQLRESDLLARVGGDEFAALLADVDAAQALIVADRLCQSVAAGPSVLETHRFRVTLSIGLVELAAHNSAESALRAADAAMYAAKQEGRNRVVPAEATTTRT